jgi:hypothetical protein
LLFDKHCLFVFDLTPLHKQYFTLMHLFSFHFKDLSPQLIYQNLFFVKVLLKFLNSLDFIYSHVRSLSLFSNLCLESRLHLLLFFFLRCNDGLAARDFFLNFIYFVFSDD